VGEDGGNGTDPAPGNGDPPASLTLFEKFSPLRSLDEAVLVVSIPFDEVGGSPDPGPNPGGGAPDPDPDPGAGGDPPDGDPDMSYTVTNLGWSPSTGLDPIAINNTPVVVGDSGNQAVQWVDGSLEFVFPREDVVSSRPFAINDAGVVAGQAGVPGANHVSAGTWEAGSLTLLPGLSNSNAFSEARDINEVGQVVGSSMDPNVGQVAVIWESGNVSRLPAHPDGGTSIAIAINNVGQAIGEVSLPGRGIVPVYWDGAFPMVELGTLGRVYDINDDGMVVGQGFTWRLGVSSDLESPSSALGINNHGQIVGYSMVDIRRRAVLRQDGEIIDLNDHITDSRWELQSAAAINDAGQIAGFGKFDGRLAPFLLTPIKTASLQNRSRPVAIDPRLARGVASLYQRTITGPAEACEDCEATRQGLDDAITSYLEQLKAAFDRLEPCWKTPLVEELKRSGFVRNGRINVGFRDDMRGYWPDEAISNFLNQSLPMAADSNAGSVSVQMQGMVMLKAFIYHQATRLAKHDPPVPLPRRAEPIAASAADLQQLTDAWFDLAASHGGFLADSMPDPLRESNEGLAREFYIPGSGPVSPLSGCSGGSPGVPSDEPCDVSNLIDISWIPTPGECDDLPPEYFMRVTNKTDVPIDAVDAAWTAVGGEALNHEWLNFVGVINIPPGGTVTGDRSFPFYTVEYVEGPGPCHSSLGVEAVRARVSITFFEYGSVCGLQLLDAEIPLP
jgi:probable HAF family extracellular repeat protein